MIGMYELYSMGRNKRDLFEKLSDAMYEYFENKEFEVYESYNGIDPDNYFTESESVSFTFKSYEENCNFVEEFYQLFKHEKNKTFHSQYEENIFLQMIQLINPIYIVFMYDEDRITMVMDSTGITEINREKVIY